LPYVLSPPALPRGLRQNIRPSGYSGVVVHRSLRFAQNRFLFSLLAEELGNVSQACKVMGLSRDTFYRYKSAVEDGGVESMFDKNRRKPNPKNRVDEATETSVQQHAIDFPAHG